MTSPYLNTPLRTEAEYDAEQEQSMTDIHTPTIANARTPTPWKCADKTRNGHIKITGSGLSGLVCIAGNGERNPANFAANAAFIVTACNSHEQLVEALTELLDQLNGIGIPDWNGAEGLSLEQARAALAAAREG